MKRTIACLLAALLLFSLSGCNKEDPGATTTTPTSTTVPPTSSTPSTTTPTTTPPTTTPPTTTPPTTTPPTTTPPTTTPPTTTPPTTTPPTTTPPTTTPPTTTPPATQCSHTYTDATCTAPKTCSKCGITEGSALGHQWTDATCSAPKTCPVCNTTEGTALEHSYTEGKCTLCGTDQPGYRPWGTGFWSSEPIPDADPSVDWIYIYEINPGGISQSLYTNTSTIDSKQLQEMLQYGTKTITYDGKTYIQSGGCGDPIHYTVNGDELILYLGSEDCHIEADRAILNRTGADQLTVTEVSNFWYLKVGMVFTWDRDN